MEIPFRTRANDALVNVMVDPKVVIILAVESSGGYTMDSILTLQDFRTISDSLRSLIIQATVMGENPLYLFLSGFSPLIIRHQIAPSERLLLGSPVSIYIKSKSEGLRQYPEMTASSLPNRNAVPD
jgi:hypothetical protein